MNSWKPRSLRIPHEQRSNLTQAIPLATPFQLVIDTTNACNFKCKFCPTGNPDLIKDSGRPFGNMEFDLFKKIVDDCQSFPNKIRRVDFGKDGEPFINKRFPEMVRYLKESNITEMISVATNGALLNESAISKIIDSGIDMIKVSVEAVSNEKYRSITQTKTSYNEILEKVKMLYKMKKNCKIATKTIDFNLTAAEKDKFFNDFNDISDYIDIDQPSGWNQTSLRDFTLGSNPTGYLDLPSFIKKEVCPVPFYSLSINFNGEVSICCVDWAHTTVVGDLNTQSLPDLWNGKSLFEFRKMHLTKNRAANKSCADCYAIHGWLDNLDSEAPALLAKLEEQQEHMLSRRPY